MIHTHGGQDKNANEPSKLISEVAMARLQFKVMVQVHLHFQCVNSSTQYLHRI